MADFTIQNVVILTLSISLCNVSCVYSMKYACFMKLPTYFKSRQYFQLCDKIENNNVWKDCMKIKCHLVHLEKHQNLIFNNKTEVPEELSRVFPNSVCSSTSCDIKQEKKDVYKRTSDHHKDNKHILLHLKSWSELDLEAGSNFWFDDLDMKTNNTSIVRNNYKHGTRVKELTVICNLNILPTTTYRTTHIVNMRQKRSTDSISCPRRHKKFSVSTGMTTTTRHGTIPFQSYFTDFVSNLSRQNISKNPMKYKSMRPKRKTTPHAIPGVSIASSTTDTITTTTISTPTIPSASRSTPRNHDSSSIDAKTTSAKVTSINQDTVTPTDFPAKSEHISERFECPNGKMWRTIDLTEIGESCLVMTVRSKLECMVISQQKRCPHAFYQKSTSMCQLFSHLISKSATAIQVDCVNNHCYTCVGRP